MSGVSRNINADLGKKAPVSQSEYEAAFSPESIRAEKGTDAEEKSER